MSIEDENDLIFKALSHRTRRQICDLLKLEPRTTSMLCDLLPTLDRCTVMQHLAVLEQAGLVIAERKGRERWNHLDALPIHAIHDRWIGPYAAYAGMMLNRLKQQVETPA